MYLTLLYTLSDIMSIGKLKKDIIFEGDSMEPYQRLRDMREDHDLKQAEVAAHLGISQQYYQCYESGKNELPLRHGIALAKFYNVSLDYLLGREKNTKK